MAEQTEQIERAESLARLAEHDAEQRERERAHRKSDRDFVKVYSDGWKTLQLLTKEAPRAAHLYAFLSEHIGTNGAVVVSQETLARELGCSVRYIRTLSKTLEYYNALIRFRVGGSVTAYCLNPNQVWRGWATTKEYSAFNTRTLLPRTPENQAGEARLRYIAESEPELPFQFQDSSDSSSSDQT